MAKSSPRTQNFFGLTVHGDFAVLVAFGCVFAAERFGGDVQGWAFAIAGAIAVHELGQLATLRALGAPRPFELGLHCAKRRTASLLPWQAILVALAGPAASAVVALVLYAYAGTDDAAAGVVQRLGIASATLAAVELVPLLPFDGGVALRALLEGATAGHGERIAQRISLALGLVAVAAGLALASNEVAALGGVSTVFAVLALRNERTAARDREGASLLASAKAAFDEEDDLVSARRLVGDLLDASDAPQLVGEASELGAWIELKAGNVRAAEERLAFMPDTLRPSPVLRAVLAHVRSDDPSPIHERLAAAFAKTPAVGRVVPVLVAFGRADVATALVIKDALEPEWLRSAARHLFAGRAYGASAIVSQRAFERTNLADHAYNAACALARASKLDDAVEWLAKAAAAGFTDRDVATSDPDLEPLRAHAGFAAWLVSLDAAHPYRS